MRMGIGAPQSSLMLWQEQLPRGLSSDKSFLSSSDKQKSEFPVGQVIERVSCLRQADQSYALFLPSQYQPGRPWPVVLAFDPGARGKMPLQCFKNGAEQYGFILIGSNNARNGPNEPVNQAARAMWEDAHARFSIDDRRIYLAGFSGGARVASAIGASGNKRFAGVIACAPASTRLSRDTGFAHSLFWCSRSGRL